MTRAAAILVLGAWCMPLPAAPALPVRPGKEQAALERKLHGEWVGAGPCDGRLVFRANGTYERQHQGPGGVNSAGTWKVRWDAPLPTLVLTCQTSDDLEDVGRTTEVKLVRVDDEALAYTHPAAPTSARPTRYTRDTK